MSFVIYLLFLRDYVELLLPLSDAAQSAAVADRFWSVLLAGLRPNRMQLSLKKIIFL